MASESEEEVWEARLTASGFNISGINLSDEQEVKEVFMTLGVGENEYAVKSRVRAFLRNKQLQQQQQQQQWEQPERTHQLKQRLNEMEQNIHDLRIRDSRAVSYAGYYEEKESQGRILDWAPTMQGAFLPTALQNPNRGSERDVVKPFWERVLAQPLVPGLANGYEVGYLGTKKPDITFYPGEIEMPAPHSYISFGDCKGAGWTGMSHSELGQGMQYAHRILDIQPQRRHVYGFITNNEMCVLIKGSRGPISPFGAYWEITAPLRFAEGMRLFFHYLQTDNGFVRPPTIHGSAVVIERALRPGGTCRAFTARYRQQQVVAKLYNSEEKAAQDATRMGQANQLLVAATGVTPKAQIPSVVATEGVWLLLTPVGTVFTEKTLKLRHLQRLLQTLKLIHSGGIVHRDVRPANFFLLEGNEILLNDWGSAASVGTPVLVEGSPEDVCHPELINAPMAAPQPKHDLYSLVASVADLLVPGLQQQNRRATFQEAIDAANCEDYGNVAAAFEKVGVPP